MLDRSRRVRGTAIRRERLRRQDEPPRIAALAADECGVAKSEDVLGDAQPDAVRAPVAMVDLDGRTPGEAADWLYGEVVSVAN